MGGVSGWGEWVGVGGGKHLHTHTHVYTVAIANTPNYFLLGPRENCFW